MLIKLDNLSKIYSLGELEVRAIDKIDLEIRSEEHTSELQSH